MICSTLEHLKKKKKKKEETALDVVKIVQTGEREDGGAG